ncbi:MAG: hypothetical protein IT228_04580 [Flavobacteriales bacterium]|nr:hypothetical protein [Flavobacteriales bacterium]MCC6576599.1 hypothetical protein [Flavobacteriales bacterium]NUQ14918.1 hypothetical protein [Flavobacteriales bacterium]
MSRVKRFRTKRLWYNTKAWVYLSVAVLPVALVLSAVLRFLPIAWGGAILMIAGLVLAVQRDRRRIGTYLVDSGSLVITTGEATHRIQRSEFVDASLVDRAAARDYIRQRTAGLEPGAARAMEREFIRFCSVDIGLSSLTFGIGRRLIDRLPNAKDDLVLVRLTDQRQLLLSPVYNQDLVGTLSRWNNQPEPEHGATGTQ